ncbi:hypothetical protein Peur_043935 [Populus x canadensis]
MAINYTPIFACQQTQHDSVLNQYPGYFEKYQHNTLVLTIQFYRFGSSTVFWLVQSVNIYCLTNPISVLILLLSKKTAYGS